MSSMRHEANTGTMQRFYPASGCFSMKPLLLRGFPASGPLRGTAGRGSFFGVFLNDPPRGRPFGGGGVHHKEDTKIPFYHHIRIQQFSWFGVRTSHPVNVSIHISNMKISCWNGSIFPPISLYKQRDISGLPDFKYAPCRDPQFRDDRERKE